MDNWINGALALFFTLAGIAMVGIVAMIGLVVWRLV